MKYKFKTEAHAHTKPASRCSDILPSEMASIYKGLGFDSVVITNHFMKGYSVDAFLSDFHETKKEMEKLDMYAILGMEIRFSDVNNNDYLVYGIDENDVVKAAGFWDATIEDFYKGFKNDRNVIIQAHPFREGMFLADKNSIDGVEVYNMHPGHNSKVGLAARYAKENPEFLISGGSDFHHFGQEGMCATLTKKKITDSFMFADVLKKKDFLIEIGDTVVSVK